MCVGLTPRLCECGCSEHDHEEMLSWGVQELGFPTGTSTYRGKCNGFRRVFGTPPSPCGCLRFKDMFEPDYTCRMP